MFRAILVLAAVTFALPLAPGLAQESSQKSVKRKIKYIDIHTHVGRYYWGKELTVEGLIKLMDQNGIERACVLPLISPEACLFPQTTEDALAAFRKYPDRIIGHAAGFWASISGDAQLADFGRYPKIPTPIASGGALDRLLKKYPNLYCDLSEPGGYAAIARDKKFGRDFIMRWADRCLFGTDYLMADHKVPHFDLLDSLDLPEDVQYKVYRGNAIRVLKLKDLR